MPADPSLNELPHRGFPTTTCAPRGLPPTRGVGPTTRRCYVLHEQMITLTGSDRPCRGASVRIIQLRGHEPRCENHARFGPHGLQLVQISVARVTSRTLAQPARKGESATRSSGRSRDRGPARGLRRRVVWPSCLSVQ